MGATLGTAAAFAVGLVLRLIDRPGTITQGEVDDIEASKAAQKRLNRLPMFQHTFITHDGRKLDRAGVLKHLTKQEKDA